jgi:hypothetical protein
MEADPQSLARFADESGFHRMVRVIEAHEPVSDERRLFFKAA